MKKSFELLSLLFGKTLKPESFVKDYFPQKWFHAAGPVQRFEIFTSLLQLGSGLQHVFSQYKSLVMAVGEPVIDAYEGIADKKLLDPQTAKSFLEKGATLEFDFLHKFFPPLEKAIDELKKDLDLPAGTQGKSILYYSPRGSGFSRHFDAYCNFIVQLKGKKVWTLSYNENVQDPMVHYDWLDYPYLPNELKPYWKETDEKLPTEKEVRIELTEGSCLFLPRGVWHETSASDEVSCSLNFTFSQPTLMDLFLAEMRARMVVNPEWRKLAQVTQNQKTLEEMTQALADQLKTISAESLLSRGNENLDMYQQANWAFRSALGTFHQK